MNNQKVFTLFLIASLLTLTGCQMEKTIQNYDSDQPASQPVETNLTTMERAEQMMQLEPTAYATIKTNKGDMKYNHAKVLLIYLNC